MKPKETNRTASQNPNQGTTNQPYQGDDRRKTGTSADEQNKQREGNCRADDKPQRENTLIERNQGESDPGNESKNPGQGDISRPKTKTATP